MKHNCVEWKYSEYDALIVERSLKYLGIVDVRAPIFPKFRCAIDLDIKSRNKCQRSEESEGMFHACPNRAIFPRPAASGPYCTFSLHILLNDLYKIPIQFRVHAIVSPNNKSIAHSPSLQHLRHLRLLPINNHDHILQHRTEEAKEILRHPVTATSLLSYRDTITAVNTNQSSSISEFGRNLFPISDCDPIQPTKWGYRSSMCEFNGKEFPVAAKWILYHSSHTESTELYMEIVSESQVVSGVRDYGMVYSSDPKNEEMCRQLYNSNNNGTSLMRTGFSLPGERVSLSFTANPLSYILIGPILYNSHIELLDDEKNRFGDELLKADAQWRNARARIWSKSDGHQIQDVILKSRGNELERIQHKSQERDGVSIENKHDSNKEDVQYKTASKSMEVGHKAKCNINE